LQTWPGIEAEQALIIFPPESLAHGEREGAFRNNEGSESREEKEKICVQGARMIYGSANNDDDTT
jgi:hypothetical protein